MTDAPPMDTLLGIGFGEVLPNHLGILATVLIRTVVNGEVREGIRPPLVLHGAVLEQLEDKLPELVALLQAQGLDRDTIAPAKRPIGWDEGPTIDEAEQQGAVMCTGFGFAAPEPDHTAALAYIEAAMPADAGGAPAGVYYLMPHRTLVALQEALPRVLARLQAGSAGTLAGGLNFDFAQLNFKWDASKRKVTMNRGYLSVFLRAQGIASLPPLQELMDLLARLYTLHIQAGRERIPAMEACLEDSGVKLTFHDPATITPARRAMDNRMDALYLQTRTYLREAPDHAAFWTWFDAELAPIRADAEAADETPAFDARYANILELLKDAGLMRSH